MTAIYKGQPVTVLRPATQSDPVFKEGGGEQVLIRLSDTTECIVAKSDVSEGPDKVITSSGPEPFQPVKYAAHTDHKKEVEVPARSDTLAPSTFDRDKPWATTSSSTPQ